MIEEILSNSELVSSLITGLATLLAAIIIGVAGALIQARYSRERDRQDRESQWRSHAIELTKLDLERKIKTKNQSDYQSLRPSILDFLANYRDLQELGETSPKDLYLKIIKQRIGKQQTDPDKKRTTPGQSHRSIIRTLFLFAFQPRGSRN